MAHRRIEVEADSLEAARASVRHQLAAGEVVLNEQVIADGKPHHVARHAATVAEACEMVRQSIPEGATVVEETCTHEPETRKEMLEAFDETEVSQAIAQRLGADAEVAAVKPLTPGRKGFLGLGRKPGSWEVEVHLPASAELTWKSKAKLAAEVGEKPKERFERYPGSGVCDVCNASISAFEAFKVPVATFYGSRAYKNFLRNHPMLSMMGGNVDAYIANMRAMDHTTHSAVCPSCIHMFE